MAKTTKTRNLRRLQLDRRLSHVDAPALDPPPGGWVRSIREGLGMNGRQLCERVGIARSHLSHIESGEQSRTVTMQTLDRVAEGLECVLVYALVPRAGSLEETLKIRARAVATALVDRVEGSMALEAQPTDPESRKQLIDSTAAELMRTFDKNLWDVPA